MWRTKAILAALLALLLASAAAEETLLTPEEAAPGAANYRTATVEIGSYVKDFSTGGEEYYPITFDARCETQSASFVEYTVKKKDWVEKGDVIAILSLETNEAELTEARMALENAQQTLEEGRADREDALTEAQDAARSLSDSLQKRAAALELERMEVELERFVLQQEHTVERLQKALDELTEQNTTAAVLAPASGQISVLIYKQPNERVYFGETLAKLFDPSVRLVRVQTSPENFRYGMPVTITTGRNKERTTFSGRVVAADNLLAEGQRTGYAYVAMDEQPDEELVNPQISVQPVHVDDVMIVPRKALTMTNGKVSVSLLEDGMVRKRYVYNVAYTPSDAWLLKGVSAGDTVILD